MLHLQKKVDMKNCLFVLVFIFSAYMVFGQDSTKISDKKPFFQRSKEAIVNFPNQIKSLSKPSKAALWSAILPGAGQVYNKKYWKVPFVIGGFVTVGVVHQYYAKQFRRFSYNLELKVDECEVLMEEKLRPYSAESLQRAKDYSRRYRDLWLFGGILFYGLTMADAVVDAHLKEFDVSDDLSMRIKPQVSLLNQRKLYAGVGIQFRFKN